MRIPTAEIVPGDIILLDTGSKVPADARLIEAANLEVEEALLTGESVPTRKSIETLKGEDMPLGERTNLVYGGTVVTKETAEMVLVDDNFSSIVNAIEEGRVIFQNVRKVVKFLLATNIGEDLTLIGSLMLFASKGLILTPVQILWANLATDGILDITLAMEPKERDVMDEPPRRPDARIINREIIQAIAFVAIFMAAGTLWMFNRANTSDSLIYAQTIAFTTLAMFQVFNSLNCRSRSLSVFQLGFFRNRYLIAAIIVSITLQILSGIVPFMQRALGTTPLRSGDWVLLVLVASTIFFADALRKLIRRRRAA